MAAVFVFDSGGDVNVFPSLSAAVGWLEAVDVDSGEYAAAFLHDGTVVDLSTCGETVVLTPGEQRDLADLTTRLTEYQRGARTPSVTLDPLQFANEWLRWEWEHRWPKRPAWLARRLHGEAPPQVEDDGMMSE